MENLKSRENKVFYVPYLVLPKLVTLSVLMSLLMFSTDGESVLMSLLMFSTDGESIDELANVLY